MIMAKNDFFNEISLWAKEANEEVAIETAQVARTIFTMIIDRSPYLTGRFIANWHVGPTDVNYSTMSTMNWDTKIAEINATITSDYFLKYDQAYLVNNVLYSDKVEHGWPGGRMGYAPVQGTMEKLTRVGNGFAPVGQTIGAIMGGV